MAVLFNLELSSVEMPSIQDIIENSNNILAVSQLPKAVISFEMNKIDPLIFPELHTMPWELMARIHLAFQNLPWNSHMKSLQL